MASTTATSASTSTGSEPITSTSQQSSTASSSNSPNNLNLYLQNDPARTGYNPSANFWLNYFNVLTGRMTREGAFHFRETVNRQNETRDVQRAEEYRDWNFRYSPVVTFLNDRIAELNHGQRMDASNVVCRRCPARLTPEGKVDRMSGGFEPTHGILICANEVRNRGHLEDVLAHEMVHAYDHLRFHADFRGEKDLRQAACTEVSFPILFALPHGLGRSWTAD